MTARLNLGAIPRLLRLQFTPLIIAPVLLGVAVAWWTSGLFSPGIFLLALTGSICLHLAANGIDDVYDFRSGTDGVAERAFPPDAPGWKPVARGEVTIGQAVAVSYLFYGFSFMVAVSLSLIVGWIALAIALPAILLSYFYTAPPLSLDYRGLGLGELSVFFTFGPIPALGAYYVMTRSLSIIPAIIAVPAGLLTTGVLVSHDLIYCDIYMESGKKSLTVLLGRRHATLLSTLLPVTAYALLLFLVAARLVPPLSLLALAALPAFVKFANTGRHELDPPRYGSRTKIVFIHSVLFTLLMAAGFILS